jgi:microcystin-dependent protein
MGQTPNIGLYQTPRGGDVGVWDIPLNNNDGATDYLLANVATISLTGVTSLTLSTPPATDSSWSGPYQAQSALLRFTGTLVTAGSCVVTIPRAGFFMVENLCTVSTFYVQIQSSAPGKKICAPPGEIVHMFCDGTDCKYLDMGRVGQYLDLAVTSMPAWMTNCTVQPYLNCDGSTFSAGTYPALNALLGGTTLPDLRGRVRAALNQTTGRITTASSGVDGNTLLASGGADSKAILQANFPNVSLPVTDPGHIHGIVLGPADVFSGSGSQPSFTGNTNTNSAVTGIAVSTGGSGTPLPIMPPVQIAGLTLIRAA